eukprot:4103319-Prymnesium_polylepis.1
MLARQYRAGRHRRRGREAASIRDSTTESSSRPAARTTPLPTHACADAGNGRRSAASGSCITAVRCGH